MSSFDIMYIVVDTNAFMASKRLFFFKGIRAISMDPWFSGSAKVLSPDLNNSDMDPDGAQFINWSVIQVHNLGIAWIQKSIPHIWVDLRESMSSNI